MTGMACSSNVLGLVTIGDSSIRTAINNALLERAQHGSVKNLNPVDGFLYDVKLDRRFETYLGLYSQLCTVASGTLAKLK